MSVGEHGITLSRGLRVRLALQALARLVVTVVVSGVVLYLLDGLLTGFDVTSTAAGMALALTVTVLNVLLWPLLIAFALRLTVVFVLLATLVLNGAIVMLAAQLLSGVTCSLGAGIVVAFVLALVSTLLEAVLHADAESVSVRTARRRAQRRGVLEHTDVPGVILFEIDGLGEQTLRDVLAQGRMPTLRGWLEREGHRIEPWECDLSSQTGASQAGLLLGSNDDMPAFRWYERDTGRTMVSNHPKDAIEIERRHSDGAGLLAEGGMAVGNLVSGDAPRSVATMSTVLVRGREDSADFFAYFGQPNGLIRTLLLSVRDIVAEKRAARRQIRSGEQPALPKGARGGIYPLLRVSQTVVCRDLNVATLVGNMYSGVPVSYATFVAYDEVAHHSGVMRPDALDVLDQLDGELARLERAAELAPRPYHLVVLSDHGQSQGATFKQRYGQTLEEVVEGAVEGDVASPTAADEGGMTFGVALSEATGGTGASARALRRATRSRTEDGVVMLERPPEEEHDDDAQDGEERPEVLVLASGNLALVYLPRSPQRMTLEDLQAEHPALLPALVGHEGVGFVMVRSAADGPVVLGAHGRHVLRTGQVEGEDPLAPFGATAVHHLLRHDGFTHCPDVLVNSFYDPEADEVCAFEELVGSHGGLGGRQQHAFAVVPADWSAPDGPIIGAAAMHDQLRAWLAETGQPVAPRPAR